MRVVDGVEIHGEAHMILDEQKLDHAAADEKVRGIAHGEDFGRG
jgi:hypothetical protein